MQPGQVIDPGAQKPDESSIPTNPPAPETEVVSQNVPQEQPEQPEQPSTGWEFHDENNANQDYQPTEHGPVSWTASEYIAHEKSAGWYTLLALLVVVSAAVVYFMTKELVSSIVIVVMGIAFGVFAARKPQELNYALDNSGLQIGEKHYSYGDFKSFTIIDEEGVQSISLMPLQRFMPTLSVYYDPKDEDSIADALSSYLPYQDRKQDFVDRFMRKVRF